MRTTLELPDDLFRQVKAKAALEGTTLKDLLKQYIEAGLRPVARTGRGPGRRSTLPTVPRRGSGVVPSLNPNAQARLEEDDLAKLRRSFGR